MQPLRAAQFGAERVLIRFETPPGQQSQIDWGTATVPFRTRPAVRHVFLLTLGFSRRSYYRCCPNETPPQFLDAHEQAFAYFGGHTAEHLYDRPRTVCHGGSGGLELELMALRSSRCSARMSSRTCWRRRASGFESGSSSSRAAARRD